VPDGDSFRYRSMLEGIDMPWDWPVDIAYLDSQGIMQLEVGTDRHAYQNAD